MSVNFGLLFHSKVVFFFVLVLLYLLVKLGEHVSFLDRYDVKNGHFLLVNLIFLRLFDPDDFFSLLLFDLIE